MKSFLNLLTTTSSPSPETPSISSEGSVLEERQQQMLPGANEWAKWGGIAALFEALVYIFGFTLLVFVLAPEQQTALSGQERLQYLLNHQQAYRLWMMVIYVFFGIALVPLVSSLHRQLQIIDHPLNQCATIFGYVWVVLVMASGMIGQVGLETAGRIYPNDPKMAGIIWATLEAVQDGLGGGVEVIGGLWVLLISIHAFKQAKLTLFINSTGLLVGCAGILTIIPGLSFLGAVFGLVQIIWFIGLGIHLLRRNNMPVT